MFWIMITLKWFSCFKKFLCVILLQDFESGMMLFLSWSAINRRYSGVFSLHEDLIIVTYHYPGWRKDWKQTTL